MTLYKEPAIKKPAPLSPRTITAREDHALRTFLATPNITQGPVAPPMGQFGPQPAMPTQLPGLQRFANGGSVYSTTDEDKNQPPAPVPSAPNDDPNTSILYPPEWYESAYGRNTQTAPAQRDALSAELSKQGVTAPLTQLATWDNLPQPVNTMEMGVTGRDPSSLPRVGLAPAGPGDVETAGHEFMHVIQNYLDQSQRDQLAIAMHAAPPQWTGSHGRDITAYGENMGRVPIPPEIVQFLNQHGPTFLERAASGWEPPSTWTRDENIPGPIDYWPNLPLYPGMLEPPKRFAEGGDVTTAEDDEKRRQLEAMAQANAGDIPVDAGKTFLGVPVNAPTYAEQMQQIAQGEQAGSYERTRAELQQAMNQYAGQIVGGDVPAPSQGMPGTAINPNQGGFRDAAYNPRDVEPGPHAGTALQDIMGGAMNIADRVGATPALNLIPGGGALNAGLDKLGVNTPTLGEAYNTDVPIYSDVARAVRPYVGEVGAKLAESTDPLGLSGRLGGPTASQMGRFGAEGLVPEKLGDIALNIALAGGPGEALTGIPFDDLARNATRNLSARVADNVAPSMGRFSVDAAGPRDMRNIERTLARDERTATNRAARETALQDELKQAQIAADEDNAMVRQMNAPTDLEKQLAASLEAKGVSGPAEDVARRTSEGSPPQSAVGRVAELDQQIADVHAARMAVPDKDLAEHNRLWVQENALMAERARIAPQAERDNLKGAFENLPEWPPVKNPAGQAGGGDLAPSPGTASSVPGHETPSPSSSYAAPDATGLPVQDAEKYQVSQLWSQHDINPDVEDLQLNEVRTRLYNAGFQSTGMSNARLQEVYREADARGIKLPYEEAPSGPPDMRDLMLAGRTPQSPLNAQQVAGMRLAERSQNVDNLIRESGAIRNPAEPVMTPLASELSPDDVLSQAQRLGVNIDPDVLAHGTEAAKQGEYAKLQHALDADYAQRFTPPNNAALDSVMRQNREELGFPSIVAGHERGSDVGLTPSQREFLGSQNGINSQAERVRGGIVPPSEMPAGAQTARQYGQTSMAGAQRAQGLAGKIWDAAMDASYVPMAGDVGSFLRQDVANVMNPLQIRTTKEVVAYTARAAASKEGATIAMDELRNLPLTTAKGVQVHFADVAGTNLSNREQLSSSLLNNIPLYGATQRANAMVPNARRAINVEKFLEGNPRVSWAQAQTYANYAERMTGRGTLGGAEDALKHIGPLFTSLRFALSIPERVPYLLPWTRLADGSMEMFGPVWREAVKDHAGFISTSLGAMALAEQAGADVNWESGKITLGQTDIDLWGGASQYFKMVKDAVEGTKNGLPYPSVFERNPETGKIRGTVAEFVRNKIGPLPGLAVEGAKLTGLDKKLGVTNEAQFLRPDYWDKGVFGLAGTNGEIIDHAAAHIVPLWIQDVAQAVSVANDTGGSPINAGLVSGVMGFFGAGVQSYGGRAERERGLERNTRVSYDAERIFGPELAKVIGPDARYAELGSREKQAVNRDIPKDQLAKLQEQAIKDGNQGELVQQQREDLKASYQPGFTKLDAALKDGSLTPYQVRQATTALEKHMYDAVDKIKFPEKDSSGGTFKPSPIQQAETGYRQLYEHAPKKADGSVDFTGLKQLQTSYLAAVAKSQGSDFAGRLAYNVLPRVTPTDSPIQQFYDRPELKKAVAEYNANGVNKTSYRIENPTNNALLYASGYVRSLDTPQAVEAYKRYSNGTPEINFTVDFKQDGFMSYAKLESGPLGSQVKEYRALPDSADDFSRADYLRHHPELNVLLWQTAHMSKMYSLDAYNRVARR